MMVKQRPAAYNQFAYSAAQRGSSNDIDTNMGKHFHIIPAGLSHWVS